MSILLVTDDPAIEARISASFGGALDGHLVRTPATNLDATALLAAEHEAVVVGPDLAAESALALAAVAQAERPDLSVVLIAPPSPQLYAAAMQAGVRGVFDPDDSDEQLRVTIDQAVVAARRLRDLMATTAAAPSVSGEEVPAVTLPWARKAGFKPARPSSVVSGRMQPSSVTATPSWLMGTISSARRPSARAAAALCWLTTENASCCSRVIWYFSARFSAVSPMAM